MYYTVASPGDNWWVRLDGGLGTFIGNEQDGEARWNKVDGRVNVEVGKWLIPDVAVSLRLSAFHVSSQGCDSLGNPWLDMESRTGDTYFGGYYHPMSLHGLSAMGIVTLDWTNFIYGYERGGRRRMHVQTPLGIGGVWLYGKQCNALATSGQTGDVRWRSNVAFMGGLRAEWALSADVALHGSMEMLATSGAIDWTDLYGNANPPHPNRVVDWMPSLNVGVTINLKGRRTKYRAEHGFEPIYIQRSGLKPLIIYDTIEELHRYVDNSPCEYCAHMSYLRRLEYDMKNLMPTGSAPEPPITLGTAVFFASGSSNIDLNGQVNLGWLAGQLAMCDDSTELFVVGMADTASGSPEANRVLSEKRCEAVRDALMGKHGIDGSRLVMIPLGGFALHPEAERNRSVIVVVKTDDTQAIIERWVEKAGKKH
ncbi:MAG: OmpA family protein [Bacteroidales bacterium]|nr:OmpA family protein [Bacteroidales bacterium]